MISVRSERDITGHSMIPSFLGLIYILGAVGGVVFCGSVFSFTSAEFSKPSAVSMMIHCLVPCIIILLCSTSVVGWYVIPVVFFSKGFSVSSCVLFLSGREESLLRSCILTAFPAMLSILPMMVLGWPAMSYALALRRAGYDPSVVSPGKYPGSLAAVLLFILAGVPIAGAFISHFI